MSSQARVQALFEEPACEKNQAKDARDAQEGLLEAAHPRRGGGRLRLRRGEDRAAAGHRRRPSHARAARLRRQFLGQSRRRLVGPGPVAASFTTDLTELDVVMGQGEKKLFRAIREIVEAHAPPAVFVYSTCVTALIGDDLDAVCFRAAERFGTPVVPVHAPGFVGSKNLGNKLAGEALLDHVIGSHEPDDVGPMDVNILGEFNLSGEFWMVKPLLETLGMRVRACIPGDARYLDIAGAHTARANMMVCSTALINLARKMEERWGIPYFEGSFYGVSDTSDALRQLARLLVREGADRALLERTETLIAEEEARVWARLEPYRARLSGKRVLLNTGGVKSWSVVAALQEIGIEIVGTSTKKSTDEDKERIKALAEGREARLRQHGAARPLRAAGLGQGRHHAVGRADAVHRAEGENAVARHQSGAPSPLRRLRRHGRAGAPDRSGDPQSDLGGGARAGAMGQFPRTRKSSPFEAPEDFVARTRRKFAATTADDMGEC